MKAGRVYIFGAISAGSRRRSSTRHRYSTENFRHKLCLAEKVACESVFRTNFSVVCFLKRETKSPRQEYICGGVQFTVVRKLLPVLSRKKSYKVKLSDFIFTSRL